MLVHVLMKPSPGYSDADREARTEALANVAANISSLQSMTPNITFVLETMVREQLYLCVLLIDRLIKMVV